MKTKQKNMNWDNVQIGLFIFNAFLSFQKLRASESVRQANLEEFTDSRKSTAKMIWKDPSGKDINGKDLDIICVPSSGSEFPIGETEVLCMAWDVRR